jgi:hypothetical protein
MKHKRVNKAFLLFLFSIYADVAVNAAGLRATSAKRTIQEKKDVNHHALRHATSNQETEVLRLTDDDDIEFFKSEIEHGYLGRNEFDKAMLASQIADDDGVEMEDDDQYRDRATGGFIHKHTSEVDSNLRLIVEDL